ncbi:hypothetical protein THRCLA_02724 [Thraustotheca clavata]|uniref:Uncharacterized protein n=1 Tax=Thraustotheca clavata TaxID=74557 RepID=A0A1W0A482_9STRA|nr:hypothetical protein THRCLA_02724 [Thraustotheca clavata]
MSSMATEAPLNTTAPPEPTALHAIASNVTDVHNGLSLPAVIGITAAAVVGIGGIVFILGTLLVRRWRHQEKLKALLSPNSLSNQDYEQYFPKPIEPAMLEPVPPRKSSRGIFGKPSTANEVPVVVNVQPPPASVPVLEPSKNDGWQSPIESSRYLPSEIEHGVALNSMRSTGWQSPIESSRSLMLQQSQRLQELTVEEGFSQIAEEPEPRSTMDSYANSARALDEMEWMSATETSRSIFNTMRTESDGETRESLV